LRDNALIRFVFKHGLVRAISRKADFALSLLMTTRPEGGSGRQGDKETEIRNPQSATRNPSAVAVFTGCVMDGLFQTRNDATKRVLAANACNLDDVETQVCCGALHAHAGDIETARELARRNIDAFEEFLTRTLQPRSSSHAAGCGALLKEYGELLKDDTQYAERARHFSASVRDVTEFLAQGEIRRGRRDQSPRHI
jgi:glycolate oxidase iron-sulfur subunit